jgi:hypothetical protein
MKVISANYGNDSVALIRWAYEQGWTDAIIVSVDTGFAAAAFGPRVLAAEAWATALGFTCQRLRAPLDFAHLVQAQGEFPTPKFQWCAAYLKGDTLRAWLAKHDPLLEAAILLARRRSHSPLFFDLPAEIIEAPEYRERRVMHPLYLHSETDVRALVAKTPLPWLTHRSLECDPCVNSPPHERARLAAPERGRLAALEQAMGTPYFAEAAPASIPAKTFIFDQGCGSPYGCGL